MLNGDIFSLVIIFNKSLALNINKYFHYFAIKQHINELEKNIIKERENDDHYLLDKIYDLTLFKCIYNNNHIYDGIFIKNFNYTLIDDNIILMEINPSFLINILKNNFNDFIIEHNGINYIKVYIRFLFFPLQLKAQLYNSFFIDNIHLLKYDKLNNRFILHHTNIFSYEFMFPFQDFKNIISNSRVSEYIPWIFVN